MTPAEHRCPTHPETMLTKVFSSGAGWCSRCSMFVQAAGIPEPTRERPRLTEAEARKLAAKRTRERRNKPQ